MQYIDNIILHKVIKLSVYYELMKKGVCCGLSPTVLLFDLVYMHMQLHTADSKKVVLSMMDYERERAFTSQV